ncbi:MAG: 5'-3' exonuclease H3TH domain-containing protein [Acidobacteriota bacterium]
MKIHLVDGTYELFRAYYGAPKRRNREGIEVGATIGLLSTLVVLLREETTTHIACAFDHVIESFRNDLFEGYKTGEGIEADLLAQFPLAERAAHALGIAVWPMIEFEADDALATGAARWMNQRKVEQIVVCSPDKDLAQCVQGSRVICLDRRQQRILDEEGVVAKFGVLPSSIPDWLALVGDSADGIPGIRGWGKKSASRVLSRYRHLEDIPEDAASWDIRVRRAEELAESLNSHRKEAFLYRRLATLRTDVPLKESLQDIRWQGVHGEELKALCSEIGERKLLDRVPFL